MLGLLMIVALAIISLTHWVYRWRNPKCNGKLPPGSMGFPLIGETFRFFTPTVSFHLSSFVRERMDRYGAIFRTSLVGGPLIVSTDSDFNYFIFQQENKLFQSWYPVTLRTSIGVESWKNGNDAFIHKYFKNMVLNLVGPENLKNMLPEINLLAQKTLQQWSSQGNTEVKDASIEMIFGFAAKKLISCDSNESKEILEGFGAFNQGFASLISFPFNIPGTAYYKCLQGRKRVLSKLEKILHERRSANKLQISHDHEATDFFDYVIEELDKDGTILTEGMSLDLIFILLIASLETISVTMTLGLKFLSDHPLVLKQLTEEHDMILKRRDDDSSTGLRWEEYKSMTFTFQFINETLRLGNLTPGIFRRTMCEVTYKGYTIPAGWTVMVCPSAVHLNPEKYEHPLDFNPSRWEKIGNMGPSRNFMPFGGGLRLCSGADLTKVQMAVFFHHLVSKYRWKAISGGNIVRSPNVQFPDGFHIQITEKAAISKNDHQVST